MASSLPPRLPPAAPPAPFAAQCASMMRSVARCLRAPAPRVGAAAASRGMASFTLPDLAYDYGALEPIISAEIMELHHSKHHRTYVTNMNSLHEQIEEAAAKGDASKLISLQPAYKFNAGGHLNHSIFFGGLCPPSEYEPPSGELAALIEAQFGSLEALQDKVTAATVPVQGSGWGWLGYDKAAGKLAIATCANQDPLEATTGLVPLFGIDVWEHAYYLQYKNVRPDYVKAIWQVANWKDVAARLEAAKSAVRAHVRAAEVAAPPLKRARERAPLRSKAVALAFQGGKAGGQSQTPPPSAWPLPASAGFARAPAAEALGRQQVPGELAHPLREAAHLPAQGLGQGVHAQGVAERVTQRAALARQLARGTPSAVAHGLLRRVRAAALHHGHDEGRLGVRLREAPA
eukprot:CAMPEP_0198428114 /NCGR_PEP_ID=MMETSP1452-20131203/6354_1 /TAXON_ID=1181717 /ORGANISM="Synchroma pusillum, Strain CCMP3072" /LENGTH=403 /DNA_ID=CAMNT_0044148503 /DNA_START=1 /DNA_END=1207 /DNA_ORIENTATION=+